jgi:drug/metabolite transporter (DMT)-like permease
MSNIYRRLFIYLPLFALGLFVVLMMIPRNIFVPWQYFNVWTVLQAFSLAYICLGIITLIRRIRPLGIHLLLIGLTIGVLSVLMNLLAFNSLYYITATDNSIALSIIFTALIAFGILTIRRKNNSTQNIQD